MRPVMSSPLLQRSLDRGLEELLDRPASGRLFDAFGDVDKRALLAAAERLHSFDRPALVVRAAEDRVMPPSTDDG
jgi:hypothetical protein